MAAGDTGVGAPVAGWLEIFVLRSLAFGLGGAGLLLDFTGWYTVVGGMLGLVGGAFALFTPRGELRRAALWLNGATFLVAVVILAVSFL